MTQPAAPPTPTPSLRRRVAVLVVGLFALLLVLVGVLVDIALGAQLRRDLDARLSDRASRAQQLSRDGASPPGLVAQLQGQDIRVRLVTPSGDSYGDPGLGPLGPVAPPPGAGPVQQPDPRAAAPAGPAPPPAANGEPAGGAAPAPPPPPDATSTTVTQTLPDGARLTLVADTTAITDVRQRLRAVMAVAAAVALAVAAALLAVAVGAALRPLDRMTTLAQRIAGGDRGTRLLPDRPRTDLGRAAAAFDGMLDALEDAEARARAAADQTRGFLADAAHELRTPLAGIQAIAETITTRATADDAATATPGERTDPERQRHRARLLLRETRQAARLVSDMLDLARIDEGLALQLTATDLIEIVSAEADRARLLAPTLTITVEGPPSTLIDTDPVRISQILANLLDNARRHTPPGGEIRVAVRRHDDTVELTVTNPGPPVPDDQRERIFDRLVRLQEARDRDSGGAGLGLPIARGLARAHHGDLRCLPDPRGATFVLTLPAAGTVPPAVREGR